MIELLQVTQKIIHNVLLQNDINKDIQSEQDSFKIFLGLSYDGDKGKRSFLKNIVNRAIKGI